ncbi:MAG TPA: right-handed parallel beta-helix repeat-containing protein [Acidimicrobiales bacterium]|nr:right-handed parallel beta-helix repeat-containing protein [Acidimicrobiales bacterium]
MHTSRRRFGLVAVILLTVSAFAGCVSPGSEGTADTSSSTTAPSGPAHTLKVPADYASIQDAVDAARPGDLVLVGAGVYNEAVNVTTDGVVIRGEDRNEVILDGKFGYENGIRVLGAKGVAVENMTARNYTSNGFFWTGVDGYRGSYLTAYNNGDYGIYSFDSVNGVFEHSYGSGSPDAGFYIGGCNPCNVLIDDVVAEYNGLGYSGTNSGGNLIIANSTFRHNRAGIVPNTGSYEKCYPQRDNTIVGNLVYDNNYDDGPAIDSAQLAQENGILVAGGWDNTILRNRIDDHKLAGVALVPFPETDATDIEPAEAAATCADQPKPPADLEVPDTVLWTARHNHVEGNVITNSGLADLGAFDQDASHDNCFVGNDFSTSQPTAIETLLPCEGTGTGSFDDNPLEVMKLIDRETAPSGDYKTQPKPPAQKNMPNALTAKAVAAGAPPDFDVDAVKVPTLPTS